MRVPLRKLLVAAVVVAGMAGITATTAFAVEPDHGIGGNSTACDDGQVPGTGAETGSLGHVGPVYVGAQAGSQLAVQHPTYIDLCASISTPTVCAPFVGCVGLREGLYASQRTHSAPECMGTYAPQYILQSDSGSTISVHQNNCPYG